MLLGRRGTFAALNLFALPLPTAGGAILGVGLCSAFAYRKASVSWYLLLLLLPDPFGLPTLPTSTTVMIHLE